MAKRKPRTDPKQAAAPSKRGKVIAIGLLLSLHIAGSVLAATEDGAGFVYR